VLLWGGGSNKQTAFGRRWASGDVIGVATDIDGKTIRFSHNGSWTGGMGTGAENIDFIGGFSPAFTLGASPTPASIQVNFGSKRFQGTPPPGMISSFRVFFSVAIPIILPMNI
jgi:hypothetical protein